VRAAAEKLGYSPNPLARAMITGKSRIIGLVVAYLENQFYPLAIERLSHALQARGYHILLFMASNAEGELDRLVTDLLAYQVDGIITASVAISSDVTRRCSDAGIPLVMFNRGQDGTGLSSVTSDNSGRRAQGCPVPDRGRSSTHRPYQRLAGLLDRAGSQQGLLEGMAEMGASPIAIIDGHYDRDIAVAATRELMTNGTHPDAFSSAMTTWRSPCSTPWLRTGRLGPRRGVGGWLRRCADRGLAGL
jgi:DNA-binding LacI/PurR family transcriptional regulator